MPADAFWQNVDECNYCQGRDFTLYLKSKAPRWYKDEPLTLLQCANCGLVFASPRPDPHQLYHDYLTGGPKSEEAVDRKYNRPNVMSIHSKAVETALEFYTAATGRPAENLRLFDMGCGAGTILEAARLKGIEAEGNEINLAAIKRLNELGFTAYHGFTHDLDLPKASYDIVINFDYVEHSYTPLEDLYTCNEILRDGGLMYLKTLYLDCPDHIIKEDAYQLFGSEHFHYFPVRTLCSMIKTAGFDIIDLKLERLVFIAARKTSRPKGENFGFYNFRSIGTAADYAPLVELHEALRQFQDTDSYRTRLLAKVEECRQALTGIDAWRRDTEELRAEAARQSERLKEFITQLDAASTARDRLQAELNRAQKEAAAEKARLDRALEQSTRQTAAVRDNLNLVREKQAALRADLQQSNARTRELRSKLTEKAEQLKKKKQTITSLRSSYSYRLGKILADGMRFKGGGKGAALMPYYLGLLFWDAVSGRGRGRNESARDNLPDT